MRSMGLTLQEERLMIPRVSTPNCETKTPDKRSSIQEMGNVSNSSDLNGAQFQEVYCSGTYYIEKVVDIFYMNLRPWDQNVSS